MMQTKKNALVWQGKKQLSDVIILQNVFTIYHSRKCFLQEKKCVVCVCVDSYTFGKCLFSFKLLKKHSFELLCLTLNKKHFCLYTL